MAEATPGEIAVLERQRQAVLAGEREVWLTTVEPVLSAEFLPEWPGPSHVESAEATWDVYHDFFAQFERATYDYLNVESDGGFTTIDIRIELVGRGSHTPVNVSWTVVAEFDSEAGKYTTNRWFHTRDEAVAWISASSEPADRDRA